MRTIMHVDADCFYVSCERIRAPYLRGRPVGVLGNQGSCVIARSYEMKAYGVKVAMPIWQARQLCPEGIYLKRDFVWYGLISDRMQALWHQYTEKVEYYSVDESFLDLGDQPIEDLMPLGREMQKKVLEEIGVPVSIGFAPSRTLAKIGSDLNKPQGICLITPENRDLTLASISVEEIHGIGRNLARRLRTKGIDTALELISRPREQLKAILNRPGEALWYELSGQAVLPFTTEKASAKSLSRGGLLWGATEEEVYGFVVRAFERFMESLWARELLTNSLSLLLVREDSRSDFSKEFFPEATDDYFALLQAMKRLFKEAFQKKIQYSAVHVQTHELILSSAKAPDLFPIGKNIRSFALKKAKESLNARFGPLTIRPASTAFVSDIFRDEANQYEICDIPGKICF